MPMDYTGFQQTLTSNVPPNEWTEALKAMWYDAKGDWEAAHNIAQDLHNTMGSWIHAYLHRKEGDDWNGRYWYRQAGKSSPNTSLEEEHREIVDYVLSKQ